MAVITDVGSSDMVSNLQAVALHHEMNLLAISIFDVEGET